MKLDKLLEAKTAPTYVSPLVREIRARGVAKKDCQCVVKDYVFADNEG